MIGAETFDMVRTGLVTPAGTGVPGRTRLQVGGLYKSPDLGRKLETRLRLMEGIRSVKANAVTGRVLEGSR